MNDIERKLVESLTWKPSQDSGAKDDPERAVRLFRWYLAFMREMPLVSEPWMGSWITPEGYRQTASTRFMEKCRAALQNAGFRFTHVQKEERPRSGELRPEARIQNHDGTRTRVYVHDQRGARQERHIADGEEVIVPVLPSHELLFRKDSETGWRYELHPVATRTSRP